MAKTRVSIRDVAKLAEVSLGTASQALSNKPGVAPQTRARVMTAATQLGYQQQVRITSPLSKQLVTVGLVLRKNLEESLSINPFYSYVLAGAERECQRQGLSLMYTTLEVDDLNRALDWPPMLTTQRVDGVLVVGAFLEETISQIGRQSGAIVVLVDGYSTEQRFDSIVTDNLNGAYTAVKYLIENGHRHIGLVGSLPDAYPSIRERRKGYSRALKHHDISESYIEDSPLLREAVYESTQRLLRRAPQITALFACNDNVAVAAMSAAVELGRRIPDDLSIIGFDNIDLTQEVTPPLTTIHVDKTLMGVLAVRRLRERAEYPDQVAMTTTLSTQLIIRGSVRSLVT
ncbi:MAG: LacI family DNA-binding transcriptional regulator [Chloroflexi bacterium]|nr:LacI family DNA-binding transcriptional regulator [Chloroflexota bacterium]